MRKILVKSICVLMSSLLFASTIFLTSCAGRDPRPIQISQIGDRDKLCSTLETEMEYLEKDILERLPDVSKTGSNTGLGIAGVILIVPWFFMDFSEADEIEVSALIERYNHLLITAQDKSCDIKRERLPTLIEMQRQAKRGINTPVLADQTSPESDTSVFDYYGQAEEEIDTQTYDKNLWAKALVETEGDQTKRKARYIELRANQLYSEKVGSASDAGLYQQTALVTPSTPIDISGTYVSEATTSSGGQAHGGIKVIKNIDGKLITIKQIGNTITGSDSSKTIKINGTREGNIIKYFIIHGNEIEGSWEINADATDLEGKWFTNGAGGASGIWNLTRVE